VDGERGGKQDRDEAGEGESPAIVPVGEVGRGIAVIPSSRRPGFLGMAVFSRTGGLAGPVTGDAGSVVMYSAV
jgi:hypothetical protein